MLPNLPLCSAHALGAPAQVRPGLLFFHPSHASFWTWQRLSAQLTKRGMASQATTLSTSCHLSKLAAVCTHLSPTRSTSSSRGPTLWCRISSLRERNTTSTTRRYYFSAV